MLLTLENGDKIVPVDSDVETTRKEASANGEKFLFEEVDIEDFDKVLPDDWVEEKVE
jgi:hypothetical protein